MISFYLRRNIVVNENESSESDLGAQFTSIIPNVLYNKHCKRKWRLTAKFATQMLVDN